MASKHPWQINSSDLTFLEYLGEGCFGKISKAVFKEKVVAVKRIKKGSMSEEEFLKEAHLMSKLNHRNIVSFIGLVDDKDDLSIVTEFMEKKDLLTYMKGCNELSLKKKISILKDVLSGLQYLHENNILHKDVASRNCLVDKDDVVKLSDFGLSKCLKEKSIVISSTYDVRFCAPEVITQKEFTKESDIFSFGIVVYEVMCAGSEIPYSNMTREEVAEQVPKGFINPKPEACPEELYSLMKKIWALKKEERPNTKEIFERIEDLSKKLVD